MYVDESHLFKSAASIEDKVHRSIEFLTKEESLRDMAAKDLIRFQIVTCK